MSDEVEKVEETVADEASNSVYPPNWISPSYGGMYFQLPITPGYNTPSPGQMWVDGEQLNYADGNSLTHSAISTNSPGLNVPGGLVYSAGSGLGNIGTGIPGQIPYSKGASPPTWGALVETIGAKLRRVADAAPALDYLNKSYPWMKSLPPWQPSTAYYIGNSVINGGYVYNCVVSGTSAASGGPTSVSGTISVDNTAEWAFYGTNIVTTDPFVTQTAWAQSTSYSAGNQVIANGNVYACVVAGTSAGSGSGPSSGVGNHAITDNTVTWTFMGPYNINPYAGIIPSVSAGSTQPSGLNNDFSCVGNNSSTHLNNNFQLTNVLPYYPGLNYKVGDTFTAATSGYGMVSNIYIPSSPSGSGYAVGDIGYLDGGTYSVQAEYIVTAVTGGGVTAAELYVGGAYSVAPSSFPLSTTAITGSGTGFECNPRFFPVGIMSTPYTLQVTSVNGSGGVTGLKILNPGNYSTLPPTAWGCGQGTTSGNGFGMLFYPLFSNPPWCAIRGVFNGGNYTVQGAVEAGYGILLQAAPGLSALYTDYACEFYSDAPKLCLYLGSSVAHVVIDGISYCPQLISGPEVLTDTYITLDFTNTGGRKRRFYRVEFSNDANFSLPFVCVDSASMVWAAPQKSGDITAALISDSLLTGSAYSEYMAGRTPGNRLYWELGWQNILNFSIPGTGYVSAGPYPTVSSATYISRVPQVLQANPDIVVLMGSGNDNGLSGISTAVTTLLQTLRNSGFQGPIVVFGVWPYEVLTLATENDVASGVSAFNDSLGTTFFIPLYNRLDYPYLTASFNNDPLPNGTTNTNTANLTNIVSSADNSHPIASGIEYLTKRMAADIKAFVLPNLP